MKIINNIFLLGLLTGVLFSCNKDETTGILPDNRPILSTETSAIKLVESGEAATITVTLDKVSSKPLEYRVELVNDTFGDNTDLKITDLEKVTASDAPSDGYQITIPPYTESTSFNISAIIDRFDDDEVKTLRIVPNKKMNGSVQNDAILITVEIENIKTLDMTFSWDAESIVKLGDKEYAICEYTDMDMYFVPVAGFDKNDPLAGDLKIYDAATGNCPETMLLKDGTLEDGDYYIIANLYVNQFAGAGNTTPLAVKANFYRDGVFDKLIEQNETEIFNANTPKNSNGIVAKLTVEGDNYTVTAYEE